VKLCVSSFNPTRGAPNCEDCPPGRFQNETRQSSCEWCAVGTSQGDDQATSCDDCQPGTFASTLGATLCEVTLRHTHTHTPTHTHTHNLLIFLHMRVLSYTLCACVDLVCRSVKWATTVTILELPHVSCVAWELHKKISVSVTALRAVVPCVRLGSYFCIRHDGLR